MPIADSPMERACKPASRNEVSRRGTAWRSTGMTLTLAPAASNSSSNTGANSGLSASWAIIIAARLSLMTRSSTRASSA